MSEENKINGLRIGNARVSDLLNTAIKRVDGVAVNTTAFSTGLLDTYGSAAAAYSVRRLNSNYTGACMRVRRDSDNVEADIGFNAAGHVDVLAIRDHCGSSNGFIRYWYDQSQTGGTGSGNDAGQSTADDQPQIYNGTTVITENGKPALEYDGSAGLAPASNVLNSNDLALIFVGAWHSTSNNNHTVTRFTGSTGTALFGAGSNQYLVLDGGVVASGSGGPGTAQHMYYFDTNGSTYQFRLNASAVYTGSRSFATGTNILGVGTFAPGNEADGPIQEVILWSGAKSSTDRDGIESDIMTYFNIT